MNEFEVAETNYFLEPNESNREALFKVHQKTIKYILFRKFKYIGDDIEDMVQAGNLGIMRALETYNSDQGKFQTYAWSWIYRFIQKELTATIAEENHCTEKSIIKNKNYSCRRKFDTVEGQAAMDFIPSLSDGPEYAYLKAEASEELAYAMSTVLSAKQAEDIKTHYFNDVAMSDIALSQGVTKQAVSLRINKSLKLLRDIM